MNHRYPLTVEDEKPDVPPAPSEPLPAKPPLAQPLSAEEIDGLKARIVEA
jgi:hypothetical protein